MSTMENPPPAAEADEEPEVLASKVTTVVLLTALVLVIVTAGVLGTIAVLMTKNPNSPLLGGKPLVSLGQGIHFAPVTETRPACPGEQAAIDIKGAPCYFLASGVTVTSAQVIETVALQGGTYGVRIAFAPASLDRMADLTGQLAKEQQQMAVLRMENQQTVLAAPVVTERMSGDSIMITGLTQQDAETLAATLLGPSAATAPPTADTSPPAVPSSGPSSGPTSGFSSGPETVPPTPQNGPGTSPAAVPGGSDPRFATCQQAIDNGYGGPYTRGRHPEYAWYVDKNNDGVACNPGDL